VKKLRRKMCVQEALMR